MLYLSKIAPEPESHEEVFLGRYARLRTWALQLTENDRERAEDLVHDAYVQFSLSRPDLKAIRNLDGYLYAMLRNLHLSQVRRSLRIQHRTLSIIDYDSAEIGLRAGDPGQQIRLQDELRQVCQYACVRKQTSKAGSVLILRFLHGYYPREIAEVMRSTRPAVEERLRTVRSEVRQYLKNPNSLHFMHGSSAANMQITPMGFLRATDELLNELRQTVFDSRQGSCPSSADLKKLYGGDNVSGLDKVTLGHIASCPRCLDGVNRLLDLPLLCERFPTDTIGIDKTRKGGGGGTPGGTTGGASQSELRRCRRGANDAFEHRPAELCVSVNGYQMATHSVSGDLSEQTLSINVTEKIDFVEIFGEQNLRLLFLSVEELPPDGAYRRSVRVELSDERTLEATLSFSHPWPTLQVLYSDPLPRTEAATQTDNRRLAVASVDAALLAGERDNQRTQADPPSVLVRAWRQLANRLVKSGFWLRPATVTAVLALILIATLLVVRLRVPTVSAAELLHRSIVAEQSIAAKPEVVLHRTITLEERRFNTVIAHRRIETWQSAAQGIRLRRIYDEQNNLVAGEWSKADGTSTLYRRGLSPQVRTAPYVAPRAILETGELWRLDVSAGDFNALVAGPEPIAVEETSNAYVLSYQNDAGAGNRLLRATLTLNQTDLHAIEQTLTLQRDGEVREFKFVEAGYAQDPQGSVAPGVFQPEPELLGANDGSRNGPDRTPPTGALLHNEATIAGLAETAASHELEIEVTYLLDRIKANLGEQVSVTRTTGGALRVAALVETEERKAEMLRALAPLINNPAVKIDVRTVAEAVKHEQRESKSPEAAVREVEVANGRIPADLELRTYLSARLVGTEAIDQEISRYAGRVMGHSRQALLQASALKSLIERFSPEEIRALAPEARDKWLAMVREHTLSYRREVAALRRELRPIFYRSADTATEAFSEANAVLAAERLLQLSYATDDAVRSAFTISADGRTTESIKSEQFWRSLSRAEKLAEQIQNVYQK
jgi:RNA polymerase sigma factor (sigma-70 family)